MAAESENLVSKVTFPYVLKHKGDGCGKDAYYMRQRVEAGEALFADNFVQLDGTEAMPGTLMHCGACGMAILHPCADWIESTES